MKYHSLTYADRKAIEWRLRAFPRRLSAYAFVQFIIWKGIYRVEWLRLGTTISIFFKDRSGSFMNCEPLGIRVTADTIDASFAAMDRCNSNKAYSRIENVEENRIGFYQALGYEAVPKPGEYVYERIRLARLAGDGYKSKRAAVNYFSRTYDAAYKRYIAAYRRPCLELYDCWAKQRTATSTDNVYNGMLKDSRLCLDIALRRPESLGLIGRVVTVGGSIKAFTFGYELNHDTFCILYEISELSLKGISQYIFRQFCCEMSHYRYINTMDDCGMARLQAVKQSYRPSMIIPSYIIQRPHA